MPLMVLLISSSQMDILWSHDESVGCNADSGMIDSEKMLININYCYGGTSWVNASASDKLPSDP